MLVSLSIRVVAVPRFAVLDGTIIGPQDSIVAFFAVVVGVGCCCVGVVGCCWVLLGVFSTRRCLVGFPGVCGVFGGGGVAWVWVVVYVVLLLPLAGRLPSGVGFVGCVVVV